MSESIHAKVIFRAAQVEGGAMALARALGVALDDVQAWMRSEKPIPGPALCKLLDLITEDALQDRENHPAGGCGAAPSY